MRQMSNPFRTLRDNFSVGTSFEEIEQSFINRVSLLVDALKPDEQSKYRKFYTHVLIELGKNPRDFIIDQGYATTYKNLISAVSQDRMGMMELLLALRITSEEKDTVDKYIQAILGKCDPALGISYNNGMFYPTGEELLDEDLINNSLSVLRDFPNESKDFQIALVNYRSGDGSGAISQGYICLEGLAKKVLGNTRNLAQNKVDFTDALGLHRNWKSIFHQYIEYGNDYGRHANDNRHNLDWNEVESFFYLNCLLIRLAVKKIESKQD